MDQIKIGKFIAEKRKERNMTQAQLADKLGVTDRAVSKWETGKSIPDASLMLDLCDLLKITVNDLLNGEVVSMDNYNKKTEEVLIEMVKQKETADRRQLLHEIVIGIISSLFLFSAVLIAAYIPMQEWIKVTLIVFGTAVFIVGMAFSIRIEQTAGYYKCGKCGHKHIPTYSGVLWSMHFGRTRYMKCPNCGKKSWQKKVISK